MLQVVRIRNVGSRIVLTSIRHIAAYLYLFLSFSYVLIQIYLRDCRKFIEGIFFLYKLIPKGRSFQWIFPIELSELFGIFFNGSKDIQHLSLFSKFFSILVFNVLSKKEDSGYFQVHLVLFDRFSIYQGNIKRLFIFHNFMCTLHVGLKDTADFNYS